MKTTTDFVRREDALSKVGASMGKAFGKAVFGIALEKVVERSAMALLGAVF